MSTSRNNPLSQHTIPDEWHIDLNALLAQLELLLDRGRDWFAQENLAMRPSYMVRSRHYRTPAHSLQRAFDWITMRSTHTFYVHEGYGWSGAMIERLLLGHGVRIGFHGVLHGEIFFEVPAQQAGLVELLLIKAGVSLDAGRQPNSA